VDAAHIARHGCCEVHLGADPNGAPPLAGTPFSSGVSIESLP
jgi:hypothetical protein